MQTSVQRKCVSKDQCQRILDCPVSCPIGVLSDKGGTATHRGFATRQAHYYNAWQKYAIMTDKLLTQAGITE